jgi:N-acylneuraminate cytidylyltransferase
MIATSRILAVITARGGSKGVPRKNIREVGGKPLIAWTVQAAQKSKYVDRLILSSDDAEIISVAGVFGCDAPFVRSPELAKDDTPSLLVVLDAIERVPGYDYVVLLQPTSPLRGADDIDACIERCFQTGAPASVSVCEVSEPPEWMYRLTSTGRLSPLITLGAPATRRQDLLPCYMLNGAVYVARADWLKSRRTFVTDETAACVMPHTRSIDIDSEEDLEKLKMMMESESGKT